MVCEAFLEECSRLEEGEDWGESFVASVATSLLRRKFPIS